MVVELLSFLQRVAGEARVEVDASSVTELLEILAKKYGDSFRRELMTPDGKLKKGIAVLVNGRNIVFLKGLATPLKPQDKVTLIPPAAGG